jgi:isopentenyl phosphate kinase
MPLVFLKLGGSLITDKTRPYTARLDKLDSLAAELASVIPEIAGLQLILGHGSGSFGHAAASQYATRAGVSTATGWRGFSEVWYQAAALDRLVIEALHRAGLPAVSFSPSACVIAHDGKIHNWDHSPIEMALSKGLLPVIHGDVAFDDFRGGTILSTEALFAHLAIQLHPQRILLAGLETGVWSDFPSREQLVHEITPENSGQLDPSLQSAAGSDVTGGMRSKVTDMLNLVKAISALEIIIFSGEQPGNLRRVLLGESLGTRLHRVDSLTDLH